MPTFTEYKIAAGHDNAAGLTLIGSITATSNIQFAEPAAQQLYKPKRSLLRLDGLVTKVGKDAQEWMMGVTWEQYRYMQDTYEGAVTIRTRWQNKAYANYNAYLIVPTENLNFTLNGYSNVAFLFYDLVAL